MEINYTAEPTAVKFHASDAFVRGLMGPVGSGKSVACCIEIFAKACQQTPGPDGIRRSRWAIIRNTYPELKSTTIKTWLDWFPEIEFGAIKWDAPITHHIKFNDVDLEVLFMAMDRPDSIKKVLSLELTGAWINEAREVPKAVLDAITGRVGRYPAKRTGGAGWSGVIWDTNPPDDDHWIYQIAEIERPLDWDVFKQPPALLKRGDIYVQNPLAENIGNLDLGYQYWLRMIPGKTDEWIKVYVLGEYGSVQDGKPVYPEYSDSIHCAETSLYRGLPLILGFDFGLTPACVIGQIAPTGRLNVLDELVAEDMGIRQFARDVVKPHLANNYTGLAYSAWVDPAGVQRAQTDAKSCLDELKSAGFTAEPARTNDFIGRREAVAGYLTAMRDGKPAIAIDPKCKVLRKGFNGGYKYERVQVAGDERYRDKPSKNHYSHIHDALQYLALGGSVPVRSAQAAQRRPVSNRAAQY